MELGGNLAYPQFFEGQLCFECDKAASVGGLFRFAGSQMREFTLLLHQTGDGLFQQVEDPEPHSLEFRAALLRAQKAHGQI